MLGFSTSAQETYTVDPSQSSIAFSGTLAGIPIQEQGPGSLSTTYSGSIQVNTDGTFLQFIDLGNVIAADSGSWEPLLDGSDGASPANYGLLASGLPPGGLMIPGLPAGVTVTRLNILSAIRNIDITLSGPVMPVAADLSVMATNLVTTFQAGDVSAAVTADGLIGGFIPVNDVPITNFVFAITNSVTNPAPNIALTRAGGVETLTIDLNGMIEFTAVTTNDTTFTLAGQLVASRPLPVNMPPTISSIPNLFVTAGATASVAVVASDPDPGQALTLALVGPGMLTSNEFSWGTTLGDAGLTTTITVVATDDGSPPLSATQTFMVTVNPPPNSAPTIDPLPELRVIAGTTGMVALVATDPDPNQALTFSVNAPGVISSNVLLVSTTAADAGLLTNLLVTVTDNGSPPLSDSTLIAVRVAGSPEINDLEADGTARVLLISNATAGFTYLFETSPELGTNAVWSLENTITATNNEEVFVDGTLCLSNEFFRVRIQP